MEVKTNENAVSGFFWKALEQYGVLGVQFVLQILIARILDPSAYGVIAITTVFIAISNVFIQNGFSVALVQKKEIDEDLLGSAFYFSLLLSVFFYAILFFSSPYIAQFFDMVELDMILKVMSLCLFPQAYCSIQNAILRRAMHFKGIFISSIASVCISGIVAYIAALKGMGVWALAIQQLTFSIVLLLSQATQVKWWPKLIFKINKLRDILSFGWKVLVTSLIDELFCELRSLAIGKYYSSSDLSFYNRGKQFPNLLMKSVNGSLQAVLLPKMSRIQDEKTTLHNIMHLSVSVCSFVMFPLLVLLAVIASPLIDILLTEKWTPCVIFIQMHCLYYATWPISTTNIQALYAIGRSDIVMYAESLRKILDLLILILTLKFGVVAIAIGSVAVGLLSIPIYLLPSQRYVEYRISSQIKDFSAPLILSLLMGVAVHGISLFKLPSFFLICLQLICGLVVYLLMAYVFQLPQLKYIKTLIKKRLSKEL